ncbi:MAG: PspC domain-containing protein, partial [Actinomycetes bacterium]
MSNPYPPYPPPPPPRRLERSKQNRILGGVCGGVANYLNMDPTLVRVLTVLVALFTGVPIILYLVALFVIPEEGST